MRTFTIAVAVLALIAMPANAQFKNSGGSSAADESKAKQEAREKKADDRAYKAALERIPDAKDKYDPWGVARPADPAAKPK